MDKETKIKVVNKYGGTVGYDVPDLKIHRNFYPGESKDITFEELEQLSYAPGGYEILTNYLEIKSPEAIQLIFRTAPEPEYYYSREDIITLMTSGTLDQFLDCLDFAPESVLEMIKDMAVELPLNDVRKRTAILDKLGFDVDQAIKIKNTKYDGGDIAEEGNKASSRRTAPMNSKAPAPTGRRYKPVTKTE